MENLNRGAVAVRMDGYTYISWRWLGTESADTRYNIYRGSKRDVLIRTEIKYRSLNVTNFTDVFACDSNTQYCIIPVVNGKEQADS